MGLEGRKLAGLSRRWSVNVELEPAEFSRRKLKS
jgi:hypothetical protein